VVRKSRRVVALGLTLVLACAGLAVADGAGENDAKVIGNVNPKKLDKKKFKPIALTLGVQNSLNLTGQGANPTSELIKVSKNVKINLKRAPRCTAPIPNGTPPAQARQLCPPKSLIGTGKAAVAAPGIAPQCGGDLENPPCVFARPDVLVFNGPGRNQVRLHTYHPLLGASSPIVNGRIVKASGKAFGQALSVPNAPETGALLITQFQATIKKNSKVATARCKPKRIRYQRTVTYFDGSRETVSKSQKCKVKKAKKGKKKRR